MSSVARMLMYVESKGIKKIEFYNKTGLSNGYLDKVKDLGSEKIESIISNYKDINLEWLVTGKGPMLKESKKDSSIGIPLVSLNAVAGFGNRNFSIKEEDVQERYIVPDFNGIDFMIRVKGNSMVPKFNSGDIVACRIIKESRFIQWNKPHVIATREQGLLCKRLAQSEKQDHLKAISDNKEYPPFDIPQAEITGVALVIGTIRLE